MSECAENKPKHPGGRPTKYRPEYCEKIVKFFDIDTTREVEVTTTTKSGSITRRTEERANHLRFLDGFARSIDVTHDTLLEWCKRHPEFSVAYTRAKALQKEHLATCALLGLYNPIFSKFLAVNITDWRDKQDVEHSGNLTFTRVDFSNAESSGFNPDGSKRDSKPAV